MTLDLMQVDPEWAWAPFRPSPDRRWDRRLAAHLFRRAGFGASWRELDVALDKKPVDVISELITSDHADAKFQTESDDFATTILASGDPKQLSAWWVYVMLRTPQPLLEKMTLFWHGHFATSAEKVENAGAMYNQNHSLRHRALGDFARLVHEISRDPAMLIYLDSATNRKSHPNENYARELLELFCLGEGNYSEHDIQELARCFTGWEIRRGKFRFNRFQHDFGQKTVFGKTGEFPDGDAIDVVLEQPAAARFVVGKLIRYFVIDEPAPTVALIEPLAHDLREHDWNIGHVVRRILGSQLFFSEGVIGRKVRSPVELTIGLLRSLEASTNATQLADDLLKIGQGLFYPPNVKGWDGGRAWINSSTLLGRANVIGRLVRDEKTRFAGGGLAEYFDQLDARSSAEIVDRLADLTLAIPLGGPLRANLIKLIDSKNGNRNERIADAVHALGTLPEFQLS